MQESKYSKKELASSKKYHLELGGVIVLYMVVLFASISFAKTMEAGMARTLVVLLPTLPALGMLWVIVRFLRRMDEYQRVRLLELLAIAGAITVCFSFSYGFLEGIGYPKLSGFIIYAVYMGSWLVMSLARKFLER